MKRTLTVASFFALILHPSSFLLAQGNLTPLGAPAPTMKTLDQIEPRTPISALPLSIPSGSYYLTGNLTGVTAANGLLVYQNDVTIDLNGFELVGVAGSLTGITIAGFVSNVTIRNGTIRNWEGNGIDGGGNPRVRVENVRVISNGGLGIVVDVNGEVLNCLVQSSTQVGIQTLHNCLIENCQVISTTGSPGVGITTGDSCHVSKCVSRDNLGGGISAGNNASISNCIAQGNVSLGIKVMDNGTITDCAAISTTGGGAWGIATGNTCVVSGCTARLNASDNIHVGANATVVKCTASNSAGGDGINATAGYSLIAQCNANSNNQNGINANNRTTVLDCSASVNLQSGIHLTLVGTVQRCTCDGNTNCGILVDSGGSAVILNNNCLENGLVSSGAGIRVTVSGGCRIEGNNVGQNFRGIDVLTSRNIIVKNFAFSNASADYNISATNSNGPIVNVIGVGDFTATVGSNHPDANFRY